MNIALIGFRGTGKTTICSLLARNLGKKFISTDEEIAKKTRVSLAKSMRKYPQDKFLEIESEVIERISDFDDCVFDTGYNIAIRNENLINLKKSSLIVLLTADIKTIIGRLKSSEKTSFLKNTNFNEIKYALEGLELKYKKAADYIIDTSELSPEEVCDLITHYIKMELQ